MAAETIRHRYTLFGFKTDTEAAIADAIVAIVVELTDIFTSADYPDLNRRERKEREAQRLSTISMRAKNIKLADMIDNSADIQKHDPKFAKTYLTEKVNILHGLRDAHLPLLQRAANAIVDHS